MSILRRCRYSQVHRTDPGAPPEMSQLNSLASSTKYSTCLHMYHIILACPACKHISCFLRWAEQRRENITSLTSPFSAHCFLSSSSILLPTTINPPLHLSSSLSLSSSLWLLWVRFTSVLFGVWGVWHLRDSYSVFLPFSFVLLIVACVLAAWCVLICHDCCHDWAAAPPVCTLCMG